MSTAVGATRVPDTTTYAFAIEKPFRRLQALVDALDNPPRQALDGAGFEDIAETAAEGVRQIEALYDRGVPTKEVAHPLEADVQQARALLIAAIAISDICDDLTMRGEGDPIRELVENHGPDALISLLQTYAWPRFSAQALEAGWRAWRLEAPIPHSDDAAGADVPAEG